MDCGELRERVTLLHLYQNGQRTAYQWEAHRRTYAKAEVTDKDVIFAKKGVGAKHVRFVLRHSRTLDPSFAILWQGKHCLITSVVQVGRGLDQVDCAMVQLRECFADSNCSPAGPAFPGVLVEKYVRHEEADALAMNVTCHVLVTPKPIELKRGSLVLVDQVPYEVLVGHELEQWQNEYEIVRTADL